MEETVLSEIRDGVATLTLNRPALLNALDTAMARGLEKLTTAYASEPAVRCVVIRGAGAHFMAGGDVKYFRACLELSAARREAAILEAMKPIHEAIRTIRRMPKPVVASVRGACAGFGMSLMAACDLALVSADAVLSLAYCRIGVTPDGGSTWALPRAVGIKRAAELALLGDRFTAADAERIGLVNRVVQEGDLERETAALAARLAAGPTMVYGRTKALLNASPEASLDAQLDAEEASFLASIQAPEFNEGVRAFVEKRPADFQGSGTAVCNDQA